VRVLDSLVPQVHEGAGSADVVGDVRDRDAVKRALEGIDAVVHLAARVGVGQSMYEMAEYTSANSFGTAVLLEALAEQPVRKLVVASRPRRRRRRPSAPSTP
jgi:dTDP-L-rhamnose 4-epimerase